MSSESSLEREDSLETSLVAAMSCRSHSELEDKRDRIFARLLPATLSPIALSSPVVSFHSRSNLSVYG